MDKNSEEYHLIRLQGITGRGYEGSGFMILDNKTKTLMATGRWTEEMRNYALKSIRVLVDQYGYKEIKD